MPANAKCLPMLMLSNMAILMLGKDKLVLVLGNANSKDRQGINSKRGNLGVKDGRRRRKEQFWLPGLRHRKQLAAKN